MLGDPGTCRATGLCGLPCKSWRQWETLCCLTQVSVALERDLLKYLSNAEAARIKYLLGFYFPPLCLVLLGASVLVGLIHEHLQKQNSIIHHMYSLTSFSKAPPRPLLFISTASHTQTLLCTPCWITSQQNGEVGFKPRQSGFRVHALDH